MSWGLHESPQTSVLCRLLLKACHPRGHLSCPPFVKFPASSPDSVRSGWLTCPEMVQSGGKKKVPYPGGWTAKRHLCLDGWLAKKCPCWVSHIEENDLLEQKRVLAAWALVGFQLSQGPCLHRTDAAQTDTASQIPGQDQAHFIISLWS